MATTELDFWRAASGGTSAGANIAATLLLHLAAMDPAAVAARSHPPHLEALHRARTQFAAGLRKKEQRRSPSTPVASPSQFPSLGRSFNSYVATPLHTPQPRPSVLELGPSHEADRVPDPMALRLLQHTLSFGQEAEAALLPRRQIRGSVSCGMYGTAFLDAKGQPEAVGDVFLPPSPQWQAFRQVVCLDRAVALLSREGNELLLAGTFEEGAPQRMTYARRRSSPLQRQAHEPFPGSDDEAVSTPANAWQVAGSNITTIAGSRTRLACLQRGGVVHMVSPTVVHYSPSFGVVPFRRCAQLSLGQGPDVFLVADTPDRGVFKCTASSRTGTTPRSVTTLRNKAFRVVSAGYLFVLALDCAGRVWANGRNEKGQLGVSASTDVVRTFTLCESLADRFVLVDAAAGRLHSVVVSRGGEVFATGDNTYGQLGVDLLHHGSFTNAFVRIPLLGPCDAVFCGPYSTFFVLRSGHVYACGVNDRGQLGLPPCRIVLEPTEVAVMTQRGIAGHRSETAPTVEPLPKEKTACCSCVIS